MYIKKRKLNICSEKKEKECFKDECKKWMVKCKMLLLVGHFAPPLTGRFAPPPLISIQSCIFHWNCLPLNDPPFDSRMWYQSNLLHNYLLIILGGALCPTPGGAMPHSCVGLFAPRLHIIEIMWSWIHVFRQWVTFGLKILTTKFIILNMKPCLRQQPQFHMNKILCHYIFIRNLCDWYVFFFFSV